MKFTLKHKSFDISCLDQIQADRIEELLNDLGCSFCRYPTGFRLVSKRGDDVHSLAVTVNEAVEAWGDREELTDLASINRRAYDLGLLGVSGDLGWFEEDD